MTREKLRPKTCCEVCGNTNKKILHRHHIVPRANANSDNSDWNLAILCPNCHSATHCEQINIIGVFPSTSGKILVYVKDGVCNVPGLENSKPYYTPKPKKSLLVDEGLDEV